MAMNKAVFPIFALFSLGIISWAVRFRFFQNHFMSGVDNWYWLLSAEDVKKRYRLPPRLPYFMLEIEEQWYPPLFAACLALVPMGVLKRHGRTIAQLIDLVNGLFIFLSVLWGSRNVILAFMAALSYLLAFFPLSYSSQLQPRGLANIILTLAVVGVWLYAGSHNLLLGGGILLLSVGLLFLHKMTAQLWVVYLLGLTLWARDWTLFLLAPTSVLLAILISKGFYLKVLRAHWDIVSFWHKNIRYLGCHPYYESPQYRREGFASTAVHQRGALHSMRKLLSLFQYNVFIVFLPVLIYHAEFHPLSRLEVFLWWWLGLTYLWAFLTTFVPFFKALGAGVYYVYQSFFPLFLLAALAIRTMPPRLQYGLALLEGVALLFSWILWKRYLVSFRSAKGGSSEDDLREVLNYLNGLPEDGVFCIPFTLPDITAYWTRKKVFWGGHSYGFRAYLEPYFPIMRENLLNTLKEKPLAYLLFWCKYLNSLEDVGLSVGRDLRFLFGKGDYQLYEVIKGSPCGPLRN